MHNVESLVIGWLNEQTLDATAYADIPATRPDAFITVERTGGGRSDVRDMPQLAVQCWSTTRHSASELAIAVDEVIDGLADIDSIARVRRIGLYNFPDIASNTPRYQLLIELILATNT